MARMKMTWPGMVVAVLMCVAFGFVAAEAPAIAAAVYGYMSVEPPNHGSGPHFIWFMIQFLAATISVAQVIASVLISQFILKEGLVNSMFHCDGSFFPSRNFVVRDVLKTIFLLPAILVVPVVIAVLKAFGLSDRLFGLIVRLIGYLTNIRLTTTEE